MNLIILYGPPGVGKLTVAKELSKITNYKLFHNHVTFDAVSTFFGPGTPEFFRHLAQIRIYLLKSAIKKGLNGTIFTFVYRYGSGRAREDDKFIKRIIKMIKKSNGNVFFVRLHCEQNLLKRRIKHPNRRFFKKVHKLKTLKTMLKKYNLYKDIPYVDSLVIDNTKLKPRSVANRIKEFFKL